MHIKIHILHIIVFLYAYSIHWTDQEMTVIKSNNQTQQNKTKQTNTTQYDNQNKWSNNNNNLKSRRKYKTSKQSNKNNLNLCEL